MRFAILIAIAIAGAACGHQPAATQGAGDGASQLAGQGAGASGEAGAAGTSDVSATAGTTAIAGAAAASAGTSAGTGAGTGGTSAPAVGDPPPARTTEPVIPEPRGECPELVTGTVTVMGMSVEVLAGTPGATPGPLLLVWHTTGVTGQTAIDMIPSSVKREIMETGGIVFAPNSDGQVREGLDTGPAHELWFTSDFALADELVACAYKHRGIDPRRIYTMGCVAGALMAGALTLERSSYIAAAAISSGGLFTNDAFTLQDPQRVPSVFSMYGSTELVSISFQHTSQLLAHAITVAGGFAVECAHSLGHCSVTVEAHESAWKFLKAHPFGVAPFPYGGGLPSHFPESCQISPREDPAAQRICGGTHAPCNAYAPSDEPSFCTRHGCTWESGACTGTPHACADIANDECGIDASDHRGCEPL